MPSSDQPKRHFIFGDESSHRGKSKFMVYGIVTCPEETGASIRKALAFPDFHHEFHWKKCGHHIAQHRKFVNAIFDCMHSKQFKFRCIVVNRRHMNNAEFNDNDPDLALEKYIYRQLLNTALKAEPNVRFTVRLDEGREKKYPPEDMERMLNGGYRKENGRGFTHDAFQSVRVLPSKQDRFIQAADVLSGAVAWVWNKRYEAEDKGPNKEALVSLVAKRFDTQVTSQLARLRGVKQKHYLSLGYETAQFAERGFSIWDFDLRADARRERMKVSALQCAALPDPNTRFRDLLKESYKIDLECAYCGDKHRTSLEDPRFQRFNALRISTKQRPMCEECGRRRIATLKPDPRDGLLLVGLKKPA